MANVIVTTVTDDETCTTVLSSLTEDQTDALYEYLRNNLSDNLTSEVYS